MHALDLYQLGRWLNRIAEEAMRPPELPVTPAGVRLILADVAANPKTAIGEIASRTGLPQSYVSESVASMREKGVFATHPDPGDARRTLVTATDAVRDTIARLGALSVDAALIEAFGAIDAAAANALVAALEETARRLSASFGGPGSVGKRLVGG